MSKERELIKDMKILLECTDIGGLQRNADVLIGRAIELLAQPEQNEQEPVAWCQMVEGKVQDLLTSFEMKDWLYDKSWMPLYTTPPTRESIDDGELEVWYSQHTWAMDKQEYMWGFRDAEKAHGITGGG